jgi:hypothetical protein
MEIYNDAAYDTTTTTTNNNNNNNNKSLSQCKMSDLQ